MESNMARPDHTLPIDARRGRRVECAAMSRTATFTKSSSLSPRQWWWYFGATGGRVAAA
jgi:hypothetical protein